MTYNWLRNFTYTKHPKMSNPESREKTTELHEGKTNTEQENFNLNYMRKEIQNIIDNHLKDTPGWFSVENRWAKSLRDLVDLLTKKTTIEELEKKHKEKWEELKRIYNEIINEYNHLTTINKLSKDTNDQLSQLNTEISLNKDLEII